MKKFFFFRSSSSNTDKVSPKSTHKQVYWDKQPDGNGKCRIKKQTTENCVSGSTPFLRRSRSSSSAAIFDGGACQSNRIDQIGSPCSTSNGPLKQFDHNSSRRALTPERQNQTKFFESAAVQNAHRVEKRGCVPSTGLQCDSSECSSYSSSNNSNGVLDRYIDGEQQLEKSALLSKSSMRNHIENGNDLRKQAPVVHYNAPTSPTNGRKQKPKSQSFREIDKTQLQFSSRDWVDNWFGNDSPRKLAKHVVERLSQTKFLPKKSSIELDPDIPITVEDIYSGTLTGIPSGNSDEVPQNNCKLDDFNGASDGYVRAGTSDFVGRNCFFADSCEFSSNIEYGEDIDFKLFNKFKDAEDQAMLLSEELEQENFLQHTELSLPSLVKRIRGLYVERINMAYNVSHVLKDWIADRASLKEELKEVRAELDSKNRRLQKEKDELQSALEKELDRRSSEWSLKLEKYQAEEHRLRERVRELAEQNVSLQREVSSFSERETCIRSRVTDSEQQVLDLTTRMEEVREETQNLQQNLSELQEKYKASEEDRDCLQRNFEEKVNECKDLHRSITRLQRTCSEHEKTIDGLRGLCEEIQKNTSTADIDNQLVKLRNEQIRLTGLEHALRKELESCRLEVDSLRHENINLLHRLKDTVKEGGFSTFKLDQELWNRICCLQNQGLSYLADSAQLCKKLLECIKVNASHATKPGLGVEGMGLSSQYVVECEVKLQGFNRGIENLTKSLTVVSTVLHEKSQLVTPESQCPVSGVDTCHNNKKSEDVIRSELRAETLLTTLLREKLYTKELEIEQLQAELAAAVRGNDILKSEVQNALDTLSCVTHQMKDLELQIIKKDENINQLQNEQQECTKELTIVRGILPKVSEERDLMWGEVKQYSEKNMLLNREINILKRKIEALDEDILLKEGQISILKDALGKPFALLASPDSANEYLVK
ncbi:hypothetical protein ACH5RR_019149 [Cinchona calisaya]|uniref:DUF7653 domain-containing protein n=1 Tax=Cinchona calisaya TaxID=153742 RepID=A0ABD2ZNJ9_9GENT